MKVLVLKLRFGRVPARMLCRVWLVDVVGQDGGTLQQSILICSELSDICG